MREAADYVVGQAVAGGSLACLCRGRQARRSVLAVVHSLGPVPGTVLGGSVFSGALQRPEEERGEAGVLLQRTRHAVASLRLGRAQHLLQGLAADDLPDLFQVLRQPDRDALAVSTRE